MYDTIEKLLNSVIQHGKQSNRVYLMKLEPRDVPEIIDKIENLAHRNRYTKIFTKVPQSAKSEFESRGYHQEASIPGFYNGTEDVAFMVKFLTIERAVNQDKQTVNEIIKIAKSKFNQGVNLKSEKEFFIITAQETHLEEMSRVYKDVFETYPFPIHDQNYLLNTMKSHVRYFCALDNNKIVALSSSEMDKKNNNVEMTDFATLNNYRGYGLSEILLSVMEKEMKKQGMIMAYTIARSISHGMNITFSKLGYNFGGTLINNTGICGSLESMNIWYKRL